MGLAGLKSSCQQGWFLLKTLGDEFSCLSQFLHPSLVAPHRSNLCIRHRISFGSDLHASFFHFEGPVWSHPLWSHRAHSDNQGKPPCLKVLDLSHLLPWRTTYSPVWGWTMWTSFRGRGHSSLHHRHLRKDIYFSVIIWVSTLPVISLSLSERWYEGQDVTKFLSLLLLLLRKVITNFSVVFFYISR